MYTDPQNPEYVYVVECVWHPIMAAGDEDGQPDSVHVVTDAGEDDAIARAQAHTVKYPLYPLSCWSPTGYRVADRRPVGTLAPVDCWPETTSAQYGHPSAVCVMDWNRCTETFCDLYASGCPHFREDEPRCPRCHRAIADVSDGEPSRIMDVTDANEEWSGVDLCVECAEYLDPTEG